MAEREIGRETKIKMQSRKYTYRWFEVHCKKGCSRLTQQTTLRSESLSLHTRRFLIKSHVYVRLKGIESKGKIKSLRTKKKKQEHLSMHVNILLQHLIKQRYP